MRQIRFIVVAPTYNGHNILYLRELPRLISKMGYSATALCLQSVRTSELGIVNDSILLTKVWDPARKAAMTLWKALDWFRCIYKIRRALRWERNDKSDVIILITHFESFSWMIKYRILSAMFHFVIPCKVMPFLMEHPNKYHPKENDRNSVLWRTDAESVLAWLQSTWVTHFIILQQRQLATIADPRLRAKAIALPDFTCIKINERPSLLERDILARAKSRPIVAMLGAIGPWKNLQLFLDLVDHTSSRGFFFLVAGKIRMDLFTIEMLKKIESKSLLAPENLIVWDEYIGSEEEYNSLIKRSSILFLLNQGLQPASSNTLTKAAYFHRPVLTNRSTPLGEIVEQFRMGRVIGGDSVDEAMQAILQMKSDVRTPEQAKQIPMYDEYYAQNSESKFMQDFRSALDRLT